MAGISTHTPHAGRDNQMYAAMKAAVSISTHTPLARRDSFRRPDGELIRISTHTPLARRDKSKQRSQKYCSNFYSHASCEARQISDAVYAGKSVISTHTPLARRDPLSDRGAVHYSNFYSHASCEARRSCRCCRRYRMKFLLTRLLRGATSLTADSDGSFIISTHTPLARRDW